MLWSCFAKITALSKIYSSNCVTRQRKPMYLTCQKFMHIDKTHFVHITFFFYRLIASGQRTSINTDLVVWQLVKLFASHEDPTLKTKVARLAKTLLEFQPDVQNQLTARRKSLENAVQGES